MCGIAGFSGNDDRALLEQMAQKIAHRGPDNIGVELLAGARVGLAHTRLSIIDLSAASNQPLWNAARSHCITFNGEIYNYRELRESLIERGYTFNTQGDAEVLLNLYCADGIEGLKAANGIYAFAIWSEAEQELLVVRDPLGVKPLYYAATGSRVVFSSELKSLLCDTTISRELDQYALSLYLRYLWCPAPLTPLLAVKKLEPGHYLRVRDGSIVEMTEFYGLPLPCPVTETAEQAQARLAATLQESVTRQLVADVKIGAFLSGGLDSSAVVALAGQTLDTEDLPCYTIDFADASQEGMQEDLPYARQVAEHLGVDLHTVKIEPNILEDFSRLIYMLDEPQADLAPLNAWYISRLAAEHGVKVLLSGAGGDDLLTGYRRHYALVNERLWAWLPRFARAGLQKVAMRLPAGRPLFRRIRKALEYAQLSPAQRIPTYFHWLGQAQVEQLFQRLPAGEDPLVRYCDALPDSLSPLQKMLQLEARFFLADHNLNYTDKVSMAEAIEVRVPLIDLAMLHTTGTISDQFKQKGREGKWIFKKAMEALLPRSVIYRPKTGFGAPVRPWLRNELKSMVDELLSAESLSRRGLFDPAQVQALIERDRAGTVDAAYTILSLMAIELWCRQFIDHAVPQPGG